MNEQTADTHAHAHHCFYCQATDAMGRMFRSMGPSPEATNHFRQSRIEFLKGIRRILDDRIDHLGRTEQKGTHVPVD